MLIGIRLSGLVLGTRAALAPEERIRSRVLKAGACGFLTKPFNDDSLFECLDMALKSQGGESSEH